MKFTIERAPFIKALGHIQSIVERRNTIPILSNVKIVADKDVTITVTDLDIYAVASVQDVKVEKSGEITVSATLLYDIAKKTSEGTNIVIELKDARLIVKSGRSRFSLPTIPADDFPGFPFSADGVQFTIAAHKLAEAIDSTKFAMSYEETRYYLNGLFWHNKDECGIAIAATDGHRLATHKLAIMEEIPDIIIPRKALGEVRKLLDDGDVKIVIADHKIEFSIGNVVIQSKLIDGTYPDYQRVIPKNNQHTLIVSPVALNEAIGRVSLIASNKTKAFKVSIDGKAGILTASVVSSENGEASEEVPCQFDGGEFATGFNSTYLRDVLSVFDDNNIQVKLGDASDPALFDGRFVVMPMRIS